MVLQESSFPALKPGLPEFGGLIRAHPRNQIGFFQEITPAVVSILIALAKLVVPQKMFCRCVGLHDSHNAARLVSAGVEANDGERSEERRVGKGRQMR